MIGLTILLSNMMILDKYLRKILTILVNRVARQIVMIAGEEKKIFWFVFIA